MHLMPLPQGSLDRDAAAVDLAQTPADIVVLSFSDGDLVALSGAVSLARAASGTEALPSLRLANLAQLKHPFSVDLYVETVASRARFVLVRILGGLDYWRYGVEELGAAARRGGFHLAAVPGCDQHDPRLDDLSTLPVEDLRRLWRYFREGGPDNLAHAFRFMAARMGRDIAWAEPRVLLAAAIHAASCRPLLTPSSGARQGDPGSGISTSTTGAEAHLLLGEKGGDAGMTEKTRALHLPSPDADRNLSAPPHALITFYRSALLAGDTAPITALADALHARGARVTAVSVTSLKDDAAAQVLAGLLEADPPDVVLNTTAFSAQRPAGGTVLDRADAPVLQVIQSGGGRDAWTASSRGLAAADLAMNVVLPEVDGRILAGVLSFKDAGAPDAVHEFTPVRHRPDPDRIAHAADLAVAWARLRGTPRAGRRLACVLSDYPGKAGRGGYAVGLDAPASLVSIASTLDAAGYAIGRIPGGAALMAHLTEGAAEPVLPLPAYERAFAALPEAFRDAVLGRWGEPGRDPDLADGVFAFRIRRAGALTMAVQPDRGQAAERRRDYHDTALPPRHGYIAFYVWLREVERVHVLIHLGTHGTLEWLPGKAVALGAACAPDAVLGPVPVVYPFIVSDPGEAAQAKRRIGAVTLGHLTPPLIEAGSPGASAELEALFDEYAEAQGLDPRRARLLGTAILERARATGLAQDCGIADDAGAEAALQRLDAWLCDLKEVRIGDGLHVFGDAGRRDPAFAACGPAETAGLLAALDGRFVPPGPAGSPAGARRDVLPTGRNLFAVDPRAVPTRTAYEIGTRAAAEVLSRYAQDHGEWPRRIVLDLWGSATMRTGGDDLGQAFALIGARPRWDHGSTRVNGFEILPQARLAFPRIDVTLRISGLFRDLFPDQIALFDAAVRAVAGLDEEDDVNPLAAAGRAAQGEPGALDRVFGPAPDHYGLGLARRIAAGDWSRRAELGETYLASSSHAYGGPSAEPREGAGSFRDRVGEADAYVHVADLPEVDLLSSDVAAEHQGGFAAAAEALGKAPALYHADATRPGLLEVRSLSEEVARVLRSRAANPRWIAGQMRHGFRGAAEIAETVDALYGFAATTHGVPSRHFDLLFDATLGDEAVRAFLRGSNPLAARSIADRFAEAATRGFWISRRNSTAAILAEMRAAA